MHAETVIRVQPDEEWLAERVGRAFAGHRDHVKAQALREFAHELQTLALAASEDPPAACTRSHGCHQAERFGVLAEMSLLAYERAAELLADDPGTGKTAVGVDT
jgi:hypothetical protein